MRYSVGDKVRVRKDLKTDLLYGGWEVTTLMLKIKGKIVTINKKYKKYYEIKEDAGVCAWTDEMLEPVEDIIEYKGKKYDVVKQPIIVGIETINQKTLKNFDKLIFLKEHKEEILDEAEKEYLSAAIRPFRDKVDFIKKYQNYNGYYIAIAINYDYDIELPHFKDKRMYKGMELDKKYTLEDLGL